MKDVHIIGLIESTPLASLSESDLTAIRIHTSSCSDCRRSFEAAEVSALLLKEGGAEAFEPSPFFHTRVLATLRDRQVTNEAWAWRRMWRAAGALASSMVATVAALAVLTFVVPTQNSSELLEATSARNTYSAEEVILNQSDLPDEQVSDGHVLTTLYDTDEDTVK